MSAPPRRQLDQPMQDAARTQASPSHCLNDEEIAAFAQGRLDGSDSQCVERHVDACESCAALLHQAMRALNTTMALSSPGAAEDWAATFARGTLVAERYQIERFIARGGMGEVYEAYDRQLHERVALKTVSASASDSPRAIRAFKAEVQLARRVTHANVCRIYDLGVHVLKSSGVVHFLTMEFVEGETLGQILRKQGPLPLAQCERFAKALLQALAAAHSAGILHRDFKSDNVMVRRDADGELTPVILDFGLARHLDERARSSGHAMVGTLTYMAPEQVDGSPLGKATDIYAFGVVWFEMLTGRVPFAGPPQLSALERLTKPPIAPSRFNRQVPRAIDAAVLRCLARQPAQRFQSAHEVLSALESTAPVHAVPRRAYAALLATMLTLGIAYAVVYNATATRPLVPRANASRPEPSAANSDPPPRVAPSAASTSASPGTTVPPAPSATATAEGSAPAHQPRKPLPAPPPLKTASPAALGSKPPTKRAWLWGGVPAAVASSGARTEAQNRTP